MPFIDQRARPATLETDARQTEWPRDGSAPNRIGSANYRRNWTFSIRTRDHVKARIPIPKCQPRYSAKTLRPTEPNVKAFVICRILRVCTSLPLLTVLHEAIVHVFEPNHAVASATTHTHTHKSFFLFSAWFIVCLPCFHPRWAGGRFADPSQHISPRTQMDAVSSGE